MRKPLENQIMELEEQTTGKVKLLSLALNEVKKVIVGQHFVLQRLLVGLLSDAHMLLEGVPGLAKTLMVRTLASTVNAKFSRVQFTPDLLPADLIGTQIYNQRSSEFETRLGPVVANFVLADEVNRAPPKLQSALLEAMQERNVTIAGKTFPLPRPFFVLATQNPIEQEGTYPLPEAQVDRFMCKVNVEYPNREEEMEIIDRTTSLASQEVGSILEPEDIAGLQRAARGVYVDEKIKEYIVSLVMATREPGSFGLDGLSDYLEYGASPRGSIYLTLGAKAMALLDRRGYVLPDDVKQIARDVLRHRIILSYEAEAEEISRELILDKILERVEVP